MPLLLHIAAAFALIRAVAFAFWKTVLFGDMARDPIVAATCDGVAIANLGFAFLFLRAAANPRNERTALYVSICVLGLRGAFATYDVLYRLEGQAAVMSMIDMIASIALFVGIVNTLPATLLGEEKE